MERISRASENFLRKSPPPAAGSSGSVRIVFSYLRSLRMHGTYTHRVTCNLYPVQYYLLERAAERARSRLAPFVRDAALAYAQQKIVLPPELEKNLVGIHQEVQRIGTSLTQIAERANTLQRITHADLRQAGQLVQALDQQVMILRHELHSLPSLPRDH